MGVGGSCRNVRGFLGSYRDVQGAGFEVQDLGLTVEVGFWLMHMLPLSRGCKAPFCWGISTSRGAAISFSSGSSY